MQWKGCFRKIKSWKTALLRDTCVVITLSRNNGFESFKKAQQYRKLALSLQLPAFEGKLTLVQYKDKKKLPKISFSTLWKILRGVFQVTTNWNLHNSSFSCTQKGLPLFNPALFGPFQDPGGGGRSALKFFPELLDGVTCSKMGLKLSSPKNLHIMIKFR